MNSLKYVQAGYSDREIFYLALRNSQHFAKTGRTLTRYQYNVPHQWQGRFRKLQVIGDQEGKGTTQWLAANSDLLPRLMVMKNVSVRFIHTIRNPYDNISTWAARTHRSLEYTIKRYFSLCQTNAWVRESVNQADILDIRHETFLNSPETGLRELCHFLDLDVSDDYLSDCISIIYKSPHKSRHAAPWTPELIEMVKNNINQFNFLEGYAYDT
jgi:hypothetical protein